MDAIKTFFKSLSYLQTFTATSKTALIAILSLIAVGCASNIGANQYEANYIGQINSTVPGTVMALRPVSVSESGSASENIGGMLIGAAAGAVLGNTIGGGSGRTLATVGGALAGGAAGAGVSQSLGTQDGIEYIIELQNGEIITLVQGPQPLLGVGQPVLVQYSVRGRSRAIPYYGY